MNYLDVMSQLESYGSEQTRKIYKNHGADLDMFGVSMKHLKVLAKKIKTNHQLGLALLLSKNVDAIYLSRWIVDPSNIQRKTLENVLNQTDYYMLIDSVIAHIAASDDSLADDCLDAWLHSDNHRFRQAAYSLFSMILSTRDNSDIDFDLVKRTLFYVKEHIHQEENRVRYSMNNFVISSGISHSDLIEFTKAIAKEIGLVRVQMGKTACKVPAALPYIEKVARLEKIGKKRNLT